MRSCCYHDRNNQSTTRVSHPPAARSALDGCYRWRLGPCTPNLIPVSYFSSPIYIYITVHLKKYSNLVTENSSVNLTNHKHFKLIDTLKHNDYTHRTASYINLITHQNTRWRAAYRICVCPNSHVTMSEYHSKSLYG